MGDKKKEWGTEILKIKRGGKDNEQVKWCGLPLDMVRAGDHCDLKMSKQMLPLLLMLGW